MFLDQRVITRHFNYKVYIRFKLGSLFGMAKDVSFSIAKLPSGRRDLRDVFAEVVIISLAGEAAGQASDVHKERRFFGPRQPGGCGGDHQYFFPIVFCVQTPEGDTHETHV